MPKAKNDKSRPHRSHAFGGCGTCRRRHTKCDQTRPTCLRCQTVGAKCTGYDSNLKWVDQGAGNTRGIQPDEADGSQPTRKHLYTERFRASMTVALQSEIADGPVNEFISRIETRTRNVPLSAGDSFGAGPFGVFSLPSTTSHVTESAHEPAPDPVTTESPPETTTAQTVQPLDILGDLNNNLRWSDLFNSDLNHQDLMSVDDPLDSTSFDRLMLAPDDFLLHSNNSTDPLPSQDLIENEVTRPSTETADPVVIARAQFNDLRDAELLLNHFKIDVIPQIMSLPIGSKTAWEVNGLNSAVLTVARLTYMTSQHVSKAALANLLAICAMSAKHLAVQDNSRTRNSVNHWQSFAARKIDQAKESLEWSLQYEYRGSNSAKYRDILMAILAVVAFSIIYDRQSDARKYMIEAEKLLRVRGLAKQYISKDVRLLHNIYTWMRIVGESTHVSRHDRSTDHVSLVHEYDQETRRFDESQTYQKTHLDDFLRLQPNFPDAGNGALPEKEGHADIHDIHLENPREHSGNFYKLLYGISETWLSLLSQTTRLANVVDRLDACPDNEAKVMQSLERRKLRLEDMIWECVTNNPNKISADDRANADVSATDAGGLTLQEPRYYMIRALNSALIIYFYRRIRNVNSGILQGHINHIIRSLKDFDQSCKHNNIAGPGSPWPAFMAGCEAMSKAQRDYFVDWFDTAFQLTGFTRLQVAKSCMLEVWKHRDNIVEGTEAAATHSWIEVAQAGNLHVLLS